MDILSPRLSLISNPNCSQANILRMAKEREEEITLDLKKRLKVLAESQLIETDEEPEPLVGQDSEVNSYDLQPTPPPVEEVVKKTSKSDESKVRYFSC